MDFIAIGDTTVDEFIKLKEASIGGAGEAQTITLPWGDKIPFDFSVLVPGVGNAANAAVAAARLGLSAGLIANVGKDRFGDEILAAFAKEGVDTSAVRVNDDIPTNHHYVLWYESERTILIRQEAYPYAIPSGFAAPKWIYLSSIGDHTEAFHQELAAWLAEHPQTKLAFQPGTFQIAMGVDKLRGVYAKTELLALNKEEAERVLGLPETDVKALLEKLRALGPKSVLITDGPRGAYADDGTRVLKVPMYPDPKPPYERTGAGDAMTSTVVAALALGKPLDEALLWGPVNAMSVVQDVGAQRGLLSQEKIGEWLAKAPADYTVSVF